MKSAVVILVILATGAFYLLTKKAEVPFINLNEGVIIMEGGIIKGNYSIDDILGIGVHYKCTFLKTDESSRISGIVRMAEDKIRGDFDIDLISTGSNLGDSGEGNVSFASHLIIKEGLAYSWTSLQPIGYKSSVAESSSNNASLTEQAQIIGLKDKIPFECSPWNAILNAFDLPSGIDFLDLKTQ